jgi:hypothetical protein
MKRDVESINRFRDLALPTQIFLKSQWLSRGLKISFDIHTGLIKNMLFSTVVAECYSFCLFFIFFNIHTSFNYFHTILLFIAIPFPHRLYAQWETPPCGGEPRNELGPALQQADALPNEPHHTKVPEVLNKLHNFEKYFSCISRRLDQSNFMKVLSITSKNFRLELAKVVL